ncbi:hypothetical protein HC031_23530 [Planosporangium thailandense]|uniref:Uncharacterized protein n=1 Tax=Planosporangium thailandense TaxID=765197 RepID=A0ABX0Y3F5_9ACTN|nr:hypothetical protein [Planosporangium thailandense]NJC72667.1 hypothetical protein [Planosporangium thailandense]
MPRTKLLTARALHRTRPASPSSGAGPSVPPSVPQPSAWDDISHLMAAGDPLGRALLGDDPALGPAGDPVPRCIGRRRPGRTPAAFLLIEPAEPLMIRHPATGRTDDLQVELLLLRGFRRFLPGAAIPAAPPGWALSGCRSGLALRDHAGNVWAHVPVRPHLPWRDAAAQDGRVFVLFGPWLGVRTPCGVREAQYGPAQRAAELRAARIRGHVAAAAVAWRP